MYALERNDGHTWRRFALCNRRYPLDQMKKHSSKPESWRVLFTPDVHQLQGLMEHAMRTVSPVEAPADRKGDAAA